MFTELTLSPRCWKGAEDIMATCEECRQAERAHGGTGRVINVQWLGWPNNEAGVHGKAILSISWVTRGGGTSRDLKLRLASRERSMEGG